MKLRNHIPDGRHTQARSALTCALPMLAVLVMPANRALAIDLDSNGDLITETVAGQDRRRVWDPAKMLGARPVAEMDRGFANPEGIRIGNFFFHPSVDETAAYDTNIFGSGVEPVADWKFITTPTVIMQSQMPRHALDLTITGKLVNYVENSDQDYGNIGALARGALHFDHAHTLSASVLSALQHEERSASTSPRDAAEPVPVLHNRISAGITRDVGRLYGTLSATAESWDYGSVRAQDGSRLSQDQRDQTLYSGQLRTGYRFSPGYDLVTKVRVVRQLNEGETPAAGDRNSDLWEGMAGLSVETNPLLRWRLLGGYGVRDYDRSNLQSVESSLIEGQVQWLATDRLTLSADISRSLVDEIGAQDNGRLETTLSGRADYEIRHDLVGNVSLGLTEQDFLGSSREDRLYEASVGLDYYYTKNWLFSLGYSFERRQSNEADYTFDRSQIRVGGKLKF